MRRKRRKQSIAENRRKWRKIKENQYLQGVLRHDKNTFHLSRQCLRDGVKSLEFIGFLGRQRRNYTLFIPLEDRIGKAEIII